MVVRSPNLSYACYRLIFDTCKISSVLIHFFCFRLTLLIILVQLAGVQCAGNPHFWVNEDGSYQEEGQKNTKGYIWGKVRFVCSV